jgi:heterodisulfide reductase subunit B
MAPLKNRIGLYPGCSLDTSAKAYESSLTAVLRELGVEREVLNDWNCCGASSAHALDSKLHLALNLRNLSLAEHQGLSDVLAPCAACYHRLASAERELAENEAVRTELCAETGCSFGNKVRVRNVLDYLRNDIGLGRIRSAVRHPLEGLRAVSYYGCLNTRVPRGECFDDRNNPTAMDKVVEALGAEAVDWSRKTECCGASLFVTASKVSEKLVAAILQEAVQRGADCIVVACPMCFNNLDTRQEEIRQAFSIARPLPVVYVTQLMGLAFGMTARQVGLHQSVVPFDMAKAGLS